MAGDSHRRHLATMELLEALGIEPTSEMVTHLNVLLEALLIRESRKIYGSAWQRYGWLSNLLSMARKADRLMQVFWFGPGDLDHKSSTDDAYDLINYAVFFIRNVEADNARGSN